MEVTWNGWIFLHFSVYLTSHAFKRVLSLSLNSRFAYHTLSTYHVYTRCTLKVLTHLTAGVSLLCFRQSCPDKWLRCRILTGIYWPTRAVVFSSEKSNIAAEDKVQLWGCQSSEECMIREWFPRWVLVLQGNLQRLEAVVSITAIWWAPGFPYISFLLQQIKIKPLHK